MKYSAEEWEFVKHRGVYISIHTYLLAFSILSYILVCYVYLVILNIQTFGFPWYDKHVLNLTKSKVNHFGASLVVQWLRIRLPMQRTWVQSLIWEDPTCHGAAKPMHHNY